MIATPDQVVYSTPFVNSLEHLEPCGHATSASTKEICDAAQSRQEAVNERKEEKRQEQYNSCTDAAVQAYETASGAYIAANPRPILEPGDIWAYGWSAAFSGAILGLNSMINQLPVGRVAWGITVGSVIAGGYLNNAPGYLKALFYWSNNQAAALAPSLAQRQACEARYGPPLPPLQGVH